MTQTEPASVPMPALYRWKLTEPVRVYGYGVGGALVLGLVLAGVVTGEWIEYLTAALGVLVAGPLSTEAARASTYSPSGAAELVRDALTQQTTP